MPEVTFMENIGLPKLELSVGDFFNRDSAPEVPEIIGGEQNALIKKASQISEKLIGHAGDLIRAPTQLDLVGINSAWNIADYMKKQNKVVHAGYSYYDLCIILIDGLPSENVEGFMDEYNSAIDGYAQALKSGSIIYEDNSPSYFDHLHDQFKLLKGRVMGVMRATNAALRTGYAVSVTSSDLPLGNLQTISRRGKVPSDFNF